MGNHAYIQQERKIIQKTKETVDLVNVFDDYGEGSICLDDYDDEFYSDDLELLQSVLEIVRDEGNPAIEAVLSYVQEHERHLCIEGTWYSWEQIKPVFDKVWNQNS